MNAKSLDYLKKIDSSKREFDAIILDPPRSGAKEEISYIANLKAKFIIYMSCDPMTLARDCGNIQDTYKVLDICMYDFFPQTYHLETLVILERR